MLIGIVGTSWPYRGGLAAFNERLARQFAAEGHEVKIFTFTLQYPDFLFPGKTQYSDAPEPSDLCIKRTVNSINPFSWFKTAKAIKQAGIELLVIKFWIPLMAPCLGTIARLARRNGIQVVSVLDNVIPHEPHFWDKWLIRYFIRSIDRFIAMSDSVKEDCLRFLPASRQNCVTLSPHPLYDNFGEPVTQTQARKELNLPADKTILLFFGAGEFYNNGRQYSELESELQLNGKICWRTDFIPDDRVRYYFSAADLIVQPYKTATQSGVTQIAYHFEKPMLVTNVGGLAEIVPDGKVGYVCDVKADDIADAISRFASMDKNKRDTQFRQNIQKEKQKYAWSRMSDAIVNS